MELTKVFVQALKDSIEETFVTILAISPVVKIKLIETPDEHRRPIIASIGLAGGTLEGSLVILMSEEAVGRATAKMLGMEVKDINQEVLDAAGEVANILAGVLKRRLSGTEYSFNISIPTVVHALSSMNVAKLQRTRVIVLEIDCPGLFDCELKLFYI